MAEELSFQDWLETILEAENSYEEEAREIEDENRDSDTYSTHTNYQATPDDPHQVRLRVTQSEPHRPEVDKQAVRQLHHAVTKEKSSVPAKKFDFDTNLEIVLDGAERYYEALQCEIVRPSKIPEL